MTGLTQLPQVLGEADGLVHAAPSGMAAHPGPPLSAELPQPELWGAEAVHRPLETEWLRTARALGCRTAGGGMAVLLIVAERSRGASRADDRAGEFEQALVKVGSALVADPQALALVRPGEGALHHPAHVAESGAVATPRWAITGLVPRFHNWRWYWSKS